MLANGTAATNFRFLDGTQEAGTKGLSGFRFSGSASVSGISVTSDPSREVVPP